MNPDQALAEWLNPLLHKLDAAERKKLLGSIARLARQKNQQRIRAQISPDGMRFAPRKAAPQKKSLRQTGFIKRGAMFSKMRLNKFIAQQSTSNEAAVFWRGRTGRIAEMHHYGRRETIAGINYHYPARELLGFSAQDIDAILDSVFSHLQ